MIVNGSDFKFITKSKVSGVGYTITNISNYEGSIDDEKKLGGKIKFGLSAPHICNNMLIMTELPFTGKILDNDNKIYLTHTSTIHSGADSSCRIYPTGKKRVEQYFVKSL